MTAPVPAPSARPAADFVPSGPERKVVFLGSADIDGAPLAYVIVLATVVAVLSFIPFSLVLSGGSSFPMAQGVYPLTGYLLGPWAGAVASGVGALLGVFLAPHTAGLPWLGVSGAILGALCAGCMRPGRHHLGLGLILAILAAAVPFVYGAYAIGENRVAPAAYILGYLTHFLAIGLFLLPTRRWVGRLLVAPELRRVALGLFVGTWSAAGVMMLTQSMISYMLFNWPAELFWFFAGVVPVEHTMRSGIGAVVGAGVIAGLRAMSLVKPREAAY